MPHRTVVGGLLGLLLVAGCGSGDQARPVAEDVAATPAPASSPPTARKSPGSSKSPASRPTLVRTPTAAPAGTPAATPRPADRLPRGDNGRITRHVDGDTIYVDAVSVRLIGIDTPETKDPGSPVECFGPKASAALARLLPVGERVRLVYDVERRDRYGRDLGYVYRLRDGLFVNAELVKRGFAGVLTIPPNVKHEDQFRHLLRGARSNDRGLWATCSSEHDAPEPTQPESSETEEPAAGGCAPGYDPCTPPYPPDLDCADVGGPITVTGSDPHGLDADNDGTACET